MKTLRETENVECDEQLWEQNVKDKKACTRVRATKRVKSQAASQLNNLATDLSDLFMATGEQVFDEALQRISELGLTGKSYRPKLNHLMREAEISPSELRVINEVCKQLGEGSPNRDVAYERAAATLGVKSKTFHGAVRIVKRTFEKGLRFRRRQWCEITRLNPPTRHGVSKVVRRYLPESAWHNSTARQDVSLDDE